MGNVWVSLQISQSTGKFKKTHGMGKVWETDTHTFRIVWVNFSPYDFHPTVYFIIWEMHGFPNQFPIVQENATKLIVWGEPGKLVLILFPYYGRFFSIRFPFYGILHHMGNACVFSLISHNLGKDSQNHRMGKVWEIGSRKYPTKPIVCGEPGKLVLILFP